jgi:hypothetical protein
MGDIKVFTEQESGALEEANGQDGSQIPQQEQNYRPEQDYRQEQDYRPELSKAVYPQQ